ncbi:MAG: hypothetical protein SFU85_03990 [Candidatus Methylacidiphilales bacterium]|nr:hypothetical protein [Candidatus Methylacidiphilales bacterium]
MKAMPEIAQFVAHGGHRITPQIVEGLLHQLPLLKAEFTQIKAPQFPHLVDQLAFLADLVEDFAEGADKNIPYVAASEATFALIYAHGAVGLIPDVLGEIGRADDSSVVRAVLIRHEAILQRYADRRGLDWKHITSNP